jgi:hypothetical protein
LAVILPVVTLIATYWQDNKSGAGYGVPMDLQRKCEERWLARFARPPPSAAPQRHELESQNQQLAAPAKAEQKTDRTEAAGSRSAPAARTGARPKPRALLPAPFLEEVRA